MNRSILASTLLPASLVTLAGSLVFVSMTHVETPEHSGKPTVVTVQTPLPTPQSALQGRQAPRKAAPSPTPSPAPIEVAPVRQKAVQAVRVATKKAKVTYIRGYSYCGASVKQAQPCIDKGRLVLYYPAGKATLAGHDYKGWYWLDDLPVGRKVVIQSGSLKGTYKVYGHASVPKKGGSFPKSGMGAKVALQTCEGSRIEFSFLKRA